MRKNRQTRKALARRSYWNFKTNAKTMEDAYKVSPEHDELQEDENPNDLVAITVNSIKDIEIMREEWNAHEIDVPRIFGNDLFPHHQSNR